MKTFTKLCLLLLLAALGFSCEKEIIVPKGNPDFEFIPPGPDPIDEEYGELRDKLKDELY